MAVGDWHQIGSYGFRETLFGPTVERVCVDCGATTYATPEVQDPRCLDCARKFRGVSVASVKPKRSRFLHVALGQSEPPQTLPPMRPVLRGRGLDGAPCAERRYLDQSNGHRRMCVLCGRVTARTDRDGSPWCGGMGDAVPSDNGCVRCGQTLDPVHRLEGYDTHPICE